MLSLAASWIVQYRPEEQDIARRLERPSPGHLLGTDGFGRDILSRVLWGSRVSLAVGVAAVLAGGIPGTLVGTYTGLSRGFVSETTMRLVDAAMSFPTLLVGLAAVVVFGPGIVNVSLAVGVSLFPRFTRLARGLALSVGSQGYVEAARAIGASETRVLFAHVLPQIREQMIIAATLWLGTAINVESSLSFLGLGINPPAPSWGNMVRDGFNVLQFAPHLVVSPILALSLTELTVNIIGEDLRDRLDPRSRLVSGH
jgi:peptide/nickel transport system permease protein